MTSSTTEPISPSRYVTGHDENGRAVFSFEGQIPTTSFDDKGRKAIFAVPWQTTTFPAECSGPDAVTLGGPLNNESGTVCRIVEFPPNMSSPPHRTVSLDYGIMVSGELELELDDGHVRSIVPGDVCVQRGTMHTWHNRTDKWARMVFVLVASKPIEVDGKPLEYVMH
ncbi:uncharacterized protein EHS24_001373 [Apiotrichum porosum]|uniref:Cupin type-2 domain-containing protein n=1 Tax=Apiotrichum porosum TaxID=105984 RepID=A0A427XKB6_9TREE|nr:uncharacterized protein EHS24_001373 [Apiotrichum porosum]RSH79331.1 hypothetical protein EHS24_001373 [Apiotrichum porosum]